MSQVNVVFNGISFEENDIIITWAQTYLLSYIESSETPIWADSILDNLRYNIPVNVYKIFFLENELDTSEKINWAVRQVDQALNSLNSCTHENFEKIVCEKISKDICVMERVKSVLANVLDQLKGFNS